MRPAAAGFIAAALCAASFADVGPGEPPPRSHAARVPAPAETPVRIAARGGPLIIEVALIPEPGSGPCGEAPAGQREYFEEAGDCLRIGASMIRLQPIAPGGGPGGHRYDRGLANYREVVRGVLQAAPAIILDVDLDGAAHEAVEWARRNGRIELCAPRGRRTLLTPVGGGSPIDTMRRVIAGGGHIRIGLRETRAWPYRGRPTNLDYLRQAVSIARSMNRPIATPEQARRMLGLKPLAPLYAVPSAESVVAGERFFLDVVAQPTASAVKGYAVVVAPDGKKYSVTGKGRVVPGVVPFSVDPEGIRHVCCRTVIDTTVTPAMPGGGYTIYLALVPLRSPARAGNALAAAKAEVTVGRGAAR